MKNKYFPDEEIEKNDLYFVCYMIERVARHIHQRNRYVVNTIGKEGLYHLLSVANVLHSENPLKVEEDWINDYGLKSGDYDITKVDKDLAEKLKAYKQGLKEKIVKANAELAEVKYKFKVN